MGEKVKVRGEHIHLTDSTNNPIVDFSLYGKAEQKQYSGKNLLNHTFTNQTSKGITITVNNDKSINVKGTATETYVKVFGSFTPTVGESYKYTTNVPKNNANCACYLANINGDSAWRNNEYDFTVETASAISIGLYVASGATVDITFYPMIRLASITDSTYEPYVGGIASPNPDYPQEITVSGLDGSVEVVSCGKNYINYKEVESTWYKPSTSSVYRKVFTLKPNTEYTLSSGFNGTGGAYCFMVSGNNLDFVVNSTNNGAPVRNPRTVTTDSNGNLVVGTYLVNGNIALENANIQLEIGTVATEYEPYTETTSTIPTPDGLCGIKVSNGGNYVDKNGQQRICDEVVKYADGSGKRVQRIGVIDSYNGESVTTDYMSTTGQLTTGATVLYVLPEPIITDLSAEEIAEIEKLHTFYPVTNISNDADCGMILAYFSTKLEFLEPKTDWTKNDAFDYVAYNRVTNNIMYLKELANYLFSSLANFSLEMEKDNLSLIYARHMNAIENGLEKINSVSYKIDIGNTKNYKPNGNVPNYEEYNRIESACLALYNEMQIHKNNLPKLAIRLGNQKGIRV